MRGARAVVKVHGLKKSGWMWCAYRVIEKILGVVAFSRFQVPAIDIDVLEVLDVGHGRCLATKNKSRVLRFRLNHRCVRLRHLDPQLMGERWVLVFQELTFLVFDLLPRYTRFWH